MVAVDLGPWLRAQSAPVAALIAPVLSIDRGVWRDRGRLYVPRWCSYLSALRPDRSERQWNEYFSWAIKTGFTGVRTFGGNIGWAGGQTPASALARLPAYLKVATEFGLAVEFTPLTGTGDDAYDPELYLSECSQVTKGRPNVITELANEYTHGSQDLSYEQLIGWGQKYYGGQLWAIGAPGEDEPTPECDWAGAGGPYGTAHLDRGRDFWNQCRRVREIYACADCTQRPVLDNEPMGADEVDGSVSGKQRINDPAFFATLGALDRGFPGVGGVHHSEAGREAVLPGPVQQQCANAYVAAHRAVDAILGQDVPLYKNAGHMDSPVLSFEDGQAVRCYSFTAGSKAATVGIGLVNNGGITWGNGWHPVAMRYEIQAADSKWLRVVEVTR